MRPFKILGIAALFILIALPASADPIEGGCTVSATSDLDTTNVTDATRSNPFVIDPGGAVSWTATSPGPIRNNTWEVGLIIQNGFVSVASGGDTNEDDDQDSEGSESIPDLISRLPDWAQRMLNQFTGIYPVFGEISGDGGACSGTAWIKIPGFRAVGIGGALGILLGAGLMASAAKPGKA